jgi:type I restriction enzyme S subunit
VMWREAVPLGKLCSVDSGPAFKSSMFKDAGQGTRLLRGENIEPGALRWTNTRTWPDELMAGHEHLLVQSGDLILGMDRPIISSGLKLARVQPSDCPALLVQRVARIRPHHVDTRYLRHWLSAPEFSQHLQRNATGTQLPHVTLRSIREFGVPRFSPREEAQIADMLEDHLSRIDAATQYLRAARKRALAFERAALARCREGEPRPLADIADIQGGIQKQQKRVPKDNAYPFLRVANVTASGLDLGDVHQVELFAGELDRLRLQGGDLLVVEGNGSAAQIGRAALWDGSIDDCVHQNHLIRVRPRAGLLPGYLEAVWNSPQNRAVLTDVSSSSSGLHTLSVAKLKPLEIPLPSVERQRDLVMTVSDVRAARSRVALEVDVGLARAAGLRRSVLTAAFAGQLTGRRPIDEERMEELAHA